MVMSKQFGAALMRQSKAELAVQVMTLTSRLEEREAVTERKDNRLEHQLCHAIEMLPHPVIIYDLDDYLVFFNQAYHEFFPYMPPIEKVVGKYFLDFIQYSIDEPGVIVDPLLQEDRQAYQAKRLDRLHNPPQGSFEQFTSGRWQLVSEHRIEGLGFFSIRQDITDRVMAEQALAGAKDEAEAANKAKSEFLSSMSHEFRTPMNAILGFSESMMEETFGPVGSDKNREYLDDIHQSGQHLLGLINDILDASAIEAGALELDEENVNLTHIVDAAIRLVKSRAEAGQVSLIASLDPEIPLFLADRRRVMQVMLNLLSNAVKFTAEGGEVYAGAWLNDDGSLAIMVDDSGVGMDTKEIGKAMTQFGQVDSGLNRKHEGTGLGLPLTKGLMELHGGTLEIKSRKGNGTVVTVTFPKERVIQNV